MGDRDADHLVDVIAEGGWVDRDLSVSDTAMRWAPQRPAAAAEQPPRFGQLPAGTRVDRYAFVYQSVELCEAIGEQELLQFQRDFWAAQEGHRPHIVRFAREEDHLPGPLDPTWRTVVALWLRAVPRATPYVVYRVAGAGLPDGARALDGKWERRDALRSDPPRFAFPTGPVTADDWRVVEGIARPTGRVEIRGDAVAEVYEVIADGAA